MKVCALFVLIFCVHSSYQQLNRQQNQIHSLAYSESDFNPLPPITRTTTTTTTTEAPETTTKKKGFFSGITGFFKSKDKETTTTTQEPTTTRKLVTTVATTTSRSSTSTTTSTTTTPKSVPTTQKLPVRSEIPPPLPSRPPPIVQQQTSTAAPKKTTKDEFPPLPTQTNNRPGTISTTGAPNAWNKPTGAPQPTVTQTNNRLGTSSTTGSPNAWNKPTGAPQPTVSPSVPNAWGTKPPGINTGSTARPQSFFEVWGNNAPSSTRKPQATPVVGDGPATDAELLTLSESLFSKDIHNPFKYVVVNYQGKTYSSGTSDEASQPLLKIDEKIDSLSTVEKMKLMYNNYEQDTAINEYVSPIERKEEDDFLEALLTTPVMRHAMNFLTQKGAVTADPQTHRALLKTIWFNLYSRGGGKIGSSGFEHVFLSEVKNGTVMGLHNWIYLSEAERTGDLDYKGWTKKIDLGNKGQIAKIRFTLNQLNKPSNSLFIGTSPELEIAIYTVCFQLRADKDCRLSYGGKDFNIVTHSYRYKGKNLIGSAYPEI